MFDIRLQLLAQVDIIRSAASYLGDPQSREWGDQINSVLFLKVSWFLCSYIHSVKVHIHDPLCPLKSQDGCQVFANAENIIKHTSFYGKYNNWDTSIFWWQYKKLIKEKTKKLRVSLDDVTALKITQPSTEVLMNFVNVFWRVEKQTILLLNQWKNARGINIFTKTLW